MARKFRRIFFSGVILLVSILASGCMSCPVAIIEGPEYALIQSQVVLSADQSYNVGDREIVSFKWTLLARPESSQLTLADPMQRYLTFQPDVPGIYLVSLVVSDGKNQSEPAYASIVALSQLKVPVAKVKVSPGQVVAPGKQITLDGNDSYDPDGKKISYKWKLLARPAESQAVLTTDNLEQLNFVPDVLGQYQIALVVTNGTVNSPQEIVTIKAQNIISEAEVDNLTDETTIKWQTNSPTICQIEYGRDTNYGSTLDVDKIWIEKHSVTLQGLRPGKSYHCRIRAKDQFGNEIASEDIAFTVGLKQICADYPIERTVYDAERHFIYATSQTVDGHKYVLSINLATGQIEHVLEINTESRALCLAADRQMLYFLGMDSLIREIDLENFTILRTISAPVDCTYQYDNLYFQSPNTLFIMNFYPNGCTPYSINLETEQIKDRSAELVGVCNMCFTTDYRSFYAYKNGVIRYDFDGTKFTLGDSTYPVNGNGYSEMKVLTITQNYVFAEWSVYDANNLKVIYYSEGNMKAVSLDGKWLFTSSYIVDTSTWKRVAAMPDSKYMPRLIDKNNILYCKAIGFPGLFCLEVEKFLEGEEKHNGKVR